MLNRRQQWRRIRPRVVLRTRVPDDITCQQLHVHVLVAQCACPGIRQCTSDKSHPRRTSQDPRSRKGEALVVARRPPGFRSRRAESPTARPTERPSVSKQASKQAQQRNNLARCRACLLRGANASIELLRSQCDGTWRSTHVRAAAQQGEARRAWGGLQETVYFYLLLHHGWMYAPSLRASGG